MVYVIPLAHHVPQCRWPGCQVEPSDLRIPLCERHFCYIGELFVDERSVLGSSYARAMQPTLEKGREKRRIQERTRDEWHADRSVVYYVRIGDYVKIGYTIYLPARISTLRVDRPALLAVEPGWREKEAERHVQFAAERQGRRENFNPSRRLLAHVDVVRAKYGEPFAFTERRVSAAGPEPIAA